MVRGSRATRLWARALHRIEHAPTDERWPAPTFDADFAHGVELYRANVRSRMLHPEARYTDVPVQLVIPLRDRYVTSPLLDGLEDWTSELRRRPVDAGHWVIRTNPDIVVAAIREFVASSTWTPGHGGRWQAESAAIRCGARTPSVYARPSAAGTAAITFASTSVPTTTRHKDNTGTVGYGTA